MQQDIGESHTEVRKVFRKVIGPQTVSDFDSLTEEEAETLQKNISLVVGDPEPALMKYVCYAERKGLC